MPPIGLLLGHVNFSELFINLSGKSYETLAAAKAAGAPTVNYGIFLNSVINFLIVAFAVFLVVHEVNRWTRKPEAPATKDCPQCAMAIPLAAKRCSHCTMCINLIRGSAGAERRRPSDLVLAARGLCKVCHRRAGGFAD